MMIITMMIKLSLCEPSRLVEGIPSVNDIFFLLCCYKKKMRKNVQANFMTLSFDPIEQLWIEVRL